MMRAIDRMALSIGAGALGILFAAPAQAAGPSYPSRAPIAEYMMASPAAEIALARSAAPPSISGNAEVLVLGPNGYTTAVKGTNGFVCLVERAWDAELGNPIFWNPHVRGPDCLNPAAARSVLPHFLERTRWALAGLSIAEMHERTKAELAAKTYVMPEPGAMAFMLSKEQFLSDDGTHHWMPHLMFFVAGSSDADAGANLPGSPVLHAYPSAPDPISTFLVPVGTWSDGTPAEMN
ncbi:MAG TPA: hypothetical protein VE968_05470 [Sphingomicrobium sp.]|nr:hypothetical protein [Sphingomicrobium sp.]